MVRTVYARLYSGNNVFTRRDVFALLQREPAIRLLNSRFGRNEGFFRSLGARDEGARVFASWNDYIHDILRRKGCSLSEATEA
jgi:hypothetical protein